MTTFTRQVASLRQTGAILEVVIAKAPAEGRVIAGRAQPLPKAVRVVAMIDTGASVTAIASSVVRALDLRDRGLALVSTPATTRLVSMRQFRVGVTFPNHVRAVCHEVVEAALGGTVECLIGRDVLSAAAFLYDGRANDFTLGF